MTALQTTSKKSVLNTANTQQILIADDDPTTRMMLRAAVSQWGYQVTEACDGEEVWKILNKADAPKLLILDWLMPKIDGVELCSRIRKDFTAKYYIILLTQLAGAANLIRGLEAGADEFLSKPFNMAELCSRLAVGSRVLNFENKSYDRAHQIDDDFLQLSQLSADMLLHVNYATQFANEAVGGKQKEQLVIELNALHTELEQSAKIIKKLEHILKT